MIIRKAWELIFLAIVIGIMAMVFMDAMQRLMPYIIIGVSGLAAVFVLFLIARYFVYRRQL